MSISKNYIMAGMIATAIVVPLSDAKYSNASEIRVTTTRVNFRTGAGTNYSSMGVLDSGTKVTYLSASGNWTKVQYNSKTGYICSDYLKKEESTSTSTMYVTPDVGLNVRKGAGTSYSVITALSKGTAVTVHSTSNGWSKITANGVNGYVSSQYLSSTKPSSSNGTTSTSTMYVTPDAGLNVRKGAGTSYSVITTLSKGTAVTVHSTSNGWSKITANGVNGYVSSQYLSSKKPSSSNGTTSTTRTMYVTPDAGLNVRKGAGTSYSVITTLSKGTAVTVHSTSNGWSKITANGVNGYVSSQYLSSKKPSSSNGTTSTTRTMYVTPDAGLNVRKGAGTSYSVITTLSKGTAVTVHSTSNGWSKITANGVNGYVSSQYLSSKKPSSSSNSSNSSSSSVNAVLNLAAQQLGKPYVWGAQGPSSFDCSGLTYYVYKNAAGITLPRVSSDQSRYGTTVSKSNLKAGDLIFFDTSGSNNGAVSHVGIYVGNGEMIHASSSSSKIVQVSIETSYWNNAYVTAKRVL